MQYYIQKLEDLSEYNFPFTRIKQVEEELKNGAGEEEEKEEPKTEEIKEDEEEKKDNITKQAEKMVDKFKKPPKKIDLESIDEGDVGESTQAEGERHVLRGFLETRVKIHLLGDQDIRTLCTKRKYQALFDIGVLSVHSADKISPELTMLFKDKARVHCEAADYLIVMKPEQRIEFRTKVYEKAASAEWTVVENPPFSHHMLFEVQNPTANALQAATGDDSSDFEL